MLTCAVVLQSAAAQPPAAPAPGSQTTVGTVTKIDAEARTISLRTDQNQAVSVSLQPNTSYRRVGPGEKDLRNAATIALTAISVGDRVLARGTNEGQTVSANLIVVMSQADVASKQLAEKADWDKRGVNGLVTAVDSESVTVSVRGPAGTSSVVIVPAPGAVVRRYSSESVNFADAKVSKLEEIKIGDQVRARGDRNENGSKMIAAEIVSGSFKTIAGVVLSVDVQNNEVRIRDLDAKIPVVVTIKADSKVQKMPLQTAQSIATRLRPETSGGRGGAKGAGSAGDIQQMLEGSPAMNLAELKNGDAVVVSSTVGSTPGRITAIRFIAGVEPILTKPGTKEMSIGSWSLDVGGNGAQ